MHNSYHFIKRLTQELQTKLIGAELIESFSQNKAEVVFGFSLQDESDLFMKFLIDAEFSCIEFRTEFTKSAKYAQNLFKEVSNTRVSSIVQTRNDRSFTIYFDNGYKLFIKLYGRRSNIILLNENDDVVRLYNYKLKKDFELKLNAIHKEVDDSEENYLENGMLSAFPTLTKIEKEFLEIDDTVSSEKYNRIQEHVNKYDDSRFYICKHNDELVFTLFPIGEIVEYYTSAIEGISRFFQLYVGPYFFKRKQDSLLQQLNAKLKSLKSYHKKSYASYEKVSNQRSKSELADIIMANLHAIPKDKLEVDLFDFYNNETITISLKKNTTPQKYAEQLYKKEKNKAIEIQKLEENISVAEERIATLEEQIERIKSATNSKDLKPLEKNLKREEAHKKEPEFKFTEYLGYKIIIGRNASNNDEVTKSARKDDLWLHAKDVQGSHVVIKRKSTESIPKNVVERAASIAAFYSKRKTDSLCPVIVTPKKFVRKIKGAPKGAVMVDKEEIVLVEPLKE